MSGSHLLQSIFAFLYGKKKKIKGFLFFFLYSTFHFLVVSPMLDDKGWNPEFCKKKEEIPFYFPFWNNIYIGVDSVPAL